VHTREGRIADSVTFLGSAARFAEFGLPEMWRPTDEFRRPRSYP